MPQHRSCLAFALRCQASLRIAQGLLGCTLPRAPAVRALSEGIEGQQQGSFSGCLAAQTQRRTENTRLPGPLAGSAAPDNQRLSPWVPRECMTDVGSLALSSPAETCAGGWGLILRVWVPAHSPNSGEAAPEPRPAGGALRPRLIGECTASREASLLGGRGGSPAPSS